jgi:serine/threonine protein kinase
VDGRAELVCVKRALFTTANRARPADQVLQLAREQTAISKFRANASLPKLFAPLHKVSSAAPFLATFPVGESLLQNANALPKRTRRIDAPVLRNALLAALGAAHAVGVCHADLRPDDIIRSGDTFVVIDWGLFTEPGQLVHQYRGCTTFIASDILLADNHGEPCAYQREHDIESARYVVYGFVHGQTHLIPADWERQDTQDLIEVRNAAVSKEKALVRGL